MFKVDVNGSGEHPIFKHLKAALPLPQVSLVCDGDVWGWSISVRMFEDGPCRFVKNVWGWSMSVRIRMNLRHWCPTPVWSCGAPSSRILILKGQSLSLILWCSGGVTLPGTLRSSWWQRTVGQWSVSQAASPPARLKLTSALFSSCKKIVHPIVVIGISNSFGNLHCPWIWNLVREGLAKEQSMMWVLWRLCCLEIHGWYCCSMLAH